MRKSGKARQSTRRTEAPKTYRGILISGEVEQSATSLHDKSHTELFWHAQCVRVFHLTCQPTAASSPLPFGLVGVNEQQALSNCLCLTRLTDCQGKKQMRRKQATLNKILSQSLQLRSELTRILSDEDEYSFHAV